MNTEIRELFRIPSWGEAVEKARELISTTEEARKNMRELVGTRGWRERYSAAIIVESFNLNDELEFLVNDFKEHPSYHVARVYADIIKHMLGLSGQGYLEKMKEACPENESGNAMVKYINERINQL